MNLQLSKLLIDTLKPSINDINVNNYPVIDNYHCNLFKFGREYILLITNDETLYSFVITGLKLKDLGNFEDVIRENIFKLLINGGFSQNQYEKILLSMERFNYTKSSNKSVISSMNNMKKLIEVWLDKDFYEINKKINDIPFKKNGFEPSSKIFNELLKQNTSY